MRSIDYRMRIIRNFLVLALLAALLVTTASWGFLVHKTVHQLSVYELPDNLQKFFYLNMEDIVTNAPRPDIRRNTDSTEASKHFIDIEAYGDSAINQLPLTWTDAVKKYCVDTLLKYGYVPYHVIFMKNKLTEAFKLGNRDSILFYAADLGHYISDANVPLHTSINYDGQLTGQKGLHSLWESMVPEIEINNYNLHSKHKARYLKHPEQEIMKAVKHANSLLPDVFSKEKEISATFSDSEKYRVQIRNGKEYKNYKSAFAKAYSAALKNTINNQLINSANLTADFWYTSWVDAGRPNLDNRANVFFTKADKKALKAEKRAFRKNRLISDSLLISKKAVIDKNF